MSRSTVREPGRWRFSPGEVAQDLAYSARLIRRSPGVVAVAVLGLGLAIGIVTSVFTLTNAVLFQGGGIDDPASAVVVQRRMKNGVGQSWPYSAYLDLREASPDVRLEASALEPAPVPLEGEGSRSVYVRFVTGGYLRELRGDSTVGRLLTSEDDRPGAEPVGVLSHGYWSRHLGADAAIVGTTLRLNGVPVTIVGVAARQFSGTADSPPAVWVPLGNYHRLLGGTPLDRGASLPVAVVGRVADGVGLEQAEARLGALAVGVMGTGAAPADERDQVTGVRLSPASGDMTPARVARLTLVLAVIGTTLGLVLLLACINVANLMLASGISRQRELGVRLAIGASAGRIVRQLITESLMLGLTAGFVGLLASIWMVPVLASVTQFPPNTDIAVDARVLMFLVLVSAASGIGAGLMPARHAVRRSLIGILKGATADTSASPIRARGLLTGAQAAASMVLLVLAALTTRGMVEATRVDIGFDAGRLLVVSASMPRDRSGADAAAYWRAMDDRLRAVPGVTTTALVSYPPFGGASRVTIFSGGGRRYTVQHFDTDANYFATLGLPIIRGRAFTADESATKANVVVISDALARDYFPGEDPIGQRLDRIIERSPRVIVGVAANAITARLGERSGAATYEPIAEITTARLMVRTAGDAGALARSVRTAAEAVDPRTRLDVRPVSDGLERQMREPRVVASLSGVLAVFALALAVIGMYGVTSFVVGQRTQEISVRMALGASRRDVARLLLADSLRPIVMGISAGVLLSVLASRVFLSQVFSRLLFGMSPLDPLAFGAAIGVLLAAATIAVILPARRAASIEPASVLRQL